MDKKEMEAVVQRQLEAYNARDTDTFVACFHPDVVVHLLMTNETIMKGRQAFDANYRKMFAANPNLHCDLIKRIVHEHVVIDEEWVTGSEKFPDGKHAVATYAFRDGLIDRVWFP